MDSRLPDPELALAVASLDDRHACKERVLSAMLVINNIQRGKVSRPSFNPHTGEVYDDA